MIEMGPEQMGATEEEIKKMAQDLRAFFIDKGISPNKAVAGAMGFVQVTMTHLMDSGFFDSITEGVECDCPKCTAKRKQHLKVVPNECH